MLFDLDLLARLAPTVLLPSRVAVRAARGPRLGTETLTGVLVATVRDPAVGPRRQTQARPPTAKDTSASAATAHFHARTASHKGYLTQAKIPARSGELPGITKTDADLTPSAAVNGPGTISCCLLHPSGGQAIRRNHGGITAVRLLEVRELAQPAQERHP